MKRFIYNTLSLHPGEGKKAFQFAFLGFLWSCAITFGMKYADSLFVIHVGSEFLPGVYASVSIGMIILSLILIRTYQHFSGYQVLVSLVSASMIFYSIIFTCLALGIGQHSLWLWYVIRIAAALFLYTMLTSFWTFIDGYHTLCNAKRMFGLFASALFLGSSTSGLLLRSGLFSFKNGTLVIIAILSATLFWAYRIAMRTKRVEEVSEYETDDTSQKSIATIILTIVKSPYTRLIIFVHFLAFLLWVIAEYNYMSFFEHYFDTHSLAAKQNEETAELTLFLGKCVSVTGIINLLFGLFVYGRLVRYFGVGTVIFVSPILYLLTFTGWIANNSILFPLMGFFVVEGTSEITEDSNLNLLLKTGPAQAKSIVRVIVESFFEPLGMLTSSILLSISFLNSLWIGFVLAFCAVIVALCIRFNYFRAPLRRRTVFVD